MSSSRILKFRRTVWQYWKANGRHDLPWRKTKDPYRILVSEMMLQQTQVPRVIGKYKPFIKKFPTVKKLAGAKLADVLKEWSGLGYNRRGKYLRDGAIEILERHKGKILNVYSELVELPGVGDYTAKAVRVFAFNEPDALIETNIRTAFVHHFYSSVLQKTAIADSKILPLAIEAAKGQDQREWHWALMDYGAYLKRSGIRNNHRSAHYTKQSKFEGSLRQIRGAILRELHQERTLVQLPFAKGKIQNAFAGLARDGLIVREKGKWQLA